LPRTIGSSRTIIVAGAGIGGLSAALALARKDFRVVVIDKTHRLEEAGAGLQLSPNVTRILIALGVGEKLARTAVPVEAICVRSQRNRPVVDIPLGQDAALRFGSPYWAAHRADLQMVLLEAAEAHPDIEIELDLKVESFVSHPNGVTVQCRRGDRLTERHGIALVGADGVWSTLRERLGETAPRFAGRTAWRATLPAKALDPEYRRHNVHLWLGGKAHLVAYPVKAGAAVNLVAIAADDTATLGWSTKSARAEVLAHFPRWFWSEDVRDILALPEGWLRWPLYDRPPLSAWGHGRMTLLGDAAHPMLPFLAQGAGMAIEDGFVLAEHLADAGDDVETALRHYEAQRAPRTARVQRGARRNDTLYHFRWPISFARNLALRTMGGRRLLDRYDWIYDWRFAPAG
jgi:salicylate hydroxylase